MDLLLLHKIPPEQTHSSDIFQRIGGEELGGVGIVVVQRHFLGFPQHVAMVALLAPQHLVAVAKCAAVQVVSGS